MATTDQRSVLTPTADAARALGVRAEVVVPLTNTEAKRERLAFLGAQVVVGGDSYAEAAEVCAARQRQTGAPMTHADDSRFTP